MKRKIWIVILILVFFIWGFITIHINNKYNEKILRNFVSNEIKEENSSESISDKTKEENLSKSASNEPTKELFCSFERR